VINTKNFFTANQNICLILFFIFSFFEIFLNNTYFNKDAALYLAQSYTFLNNGYQDSLEVYNWPFYSIFIALFSKAFSIDLTLGVKCFNLITINCLFFILLKLNRNIHKTNNLDFFLLISLLFFYRYADNYLNFVIRDHGFLLFVFLYIYFQFLYIDGLDNKKNNYRYLFYALISILLAFLFRHEALLFLFSLFFIYKKFYKLNLNKIIFSALALIGALFYISMQLESFKIYEYYERTVSLFFNLGKDISDSENIFPLSYLQGNSGLFLIPAFIIIFVIKFIALVGFLNVFFIYPFRINFNNLKVQIFSSVVVIYFALILLNFISTYVLTGRYLLFLGFAILFLTSSNLKIFYDYLSKPFKVAFLLFIVLLSLYIIFNTKKVSDEFEAVTWVNNNLHGSSVFYNQPRMNLYAHNYLYTKQEDIDYSNLHNSEYDYFVIKFYSTQNQSNVELKNLKLIKKISEKIRIYAK